MKKYIISCCVLLASFGNAQIPEGVRFIAGQIGYTSVKDNAADSETESFRILPTAGYFFAPNWAVAASLGYKSDVSKSESSIAASLKNTKDVSSAFVMIPSLRKFWVLDEKFSLYMQLDFPLEFGKIRNETTIVTTGNPTVSSVSENDYFAYGISLKPGIDFALNKRWRIFSTVGELGFSSNKKENSKGAKNAFNFGVNFSAVNFGLKYIIPRKK